MTSQQDTSEHAVQPAQECQHQRVYFSMQAGNFYCGDCHRGMGAAFCHQWKARYEEFGINAESAGPVPERAGASRQEEPAMFVCSFCQRGDYCPTAPHDAAPPAPESPPGPDLASVAELIMSGAKDHSGGYCHSHPRECSWFEDIMAILQKVRAAQPNAESATDGDSIEVLARLFDRHDGAGLGVASLRSLVRYHRRTSSNAESAAGQEAGGWPAARAACGHTLDEPTTLCGRCEQALRERCERLEKAGKALADHAEEAVTWATASEGMTPEPGDEWSFNALQLIAAVRRAALSGGGGPGK